MWSIGFLQGWIWTQGRVCLNWHLGMSTRASERQKGEAEPREQKQGLWHRSWEMQLSCRTGAQGKSHALGRKGTEVATKLQLWTWCESGSQAWAGAVATWLGWGITVSGLASLCVRESLILARLSVKVCPNLGQFDAFVSREWNAAVRCLKICVMTIEPNEFSKKLQEEFSEISGRDYAPTLQIQVSLKQTHHLPTGIHKTNVLACPIRVVKSCFIAQIQEKNLNIFLLFY